MEILKTSLFDVAGGIFIGKLLDYLPHSSGAISISTLPKESLELALHIMGIAFLSSQYFKWRTINLRGTDELKHLMFLMGLLISSTKFASRLKSFANFVANWSFGEIKTVTDSLTKSTLKKDPYSSGTNPNGNGDIATTPPDPAAQAMLNSDEKTG